MDFRPKLPANPFGDVPWVLDLDALNDSQKTTVLVLNAPPPPDLHALICASPALKHSLVVIATHEVPVLPPSHSVLPTVRVLSLERPLFDRVGALGLMSLLDKASRFASSPLATGGGLAIYSEDPVTGEFSVREEPGAVKPGTSIQHPALMLSTISVSTNASSSSETALKKKKRRTFNFFSTKSSPASSSSPSLPILSSPPSALPSPGSPSPSHHASSKTGLTSGTGRPFDTIIHYLPSPQHLPEKAILKQAILVTTLSAPYLAAPPNPPKYLRLPQRMNTINSKAAPKVTESKSMPRLRAGNDVITPMDESPRTRRNTVAVRSQRRPEDAEDRGVEPSTSTSSFKALKRKVTMTIRRKSSLAPPTMTDTEDDGGREHGDDGRKEKRLSTLSRGSGTQKRRLRKYRSSTLGADENGFIVIESSDFIPQYSGRSHVIHVVPLSTALISSPPTSPNPSHNSRSPPPPSSRHSSSSSNGRTAPKAIQKPSSSKPMLVKSIEQFLVAFAYPVQSLGALSASATSGRPSPTGSRTSSRSSSFAPSANASSVFLQSPSGPTTPTSNRSSVLSFTGASPAGSVDGGNGETKAIPFVVKSGALAAILSSPRHSTLLEPKSHTVAEWILFGALDGEKEMSLTPKVWLDVDGASSATGRGRIVCGGNESSMHAPVPVVVSYKSPSAIGGQREDSSMQDIDEEGQVAVHERSQLSPSKVLEERRVSIKPVAMVTPPRPPSPSAAYTTPKNGATPSRSGSLEPPRAPQLLTPESSISSSSGSPPSPTTSSSPPSKVTDDDNDREMSFDAKVDLETPEEQQQPKLKRSEVVGDYRKYYHLPHPRPRSRSSSKERLHLEEEKDEPKGGVEGGENRTGLLTPPDSESSSSEGGHEEDGGRDNDNVNEREKSTASSSAAGGSRPSHGGSEEGNTSNSSSGSTSQHESFDSFVRAYMYDRGSCPVVNGTAAAHEHVGTAAAEQVQGKETQNRVATVMGKEEKRASTALRDNRRLSSGGRSRVLSLSETIGEEEEDGREKQDMTAGMDSAFVGEETRGGHDALPSGGVRNIIPQGGQRPFGDRDSESRNDVGSRNHGRLFSNNRIRPEHGGGMGTKEAQEYANTLRRYENDLAGGAHVRKASMDEVVSIRSAGSVGCASPSPSISRRDVCSLLGVPPIVGGGIPLRAGGAGEEEEESEEVQMERWERKQREKREQRVHEQGKKEREATELVEERERQKEKKRTSSASHQMHYHWPETVPNPASPSQGKEQAPRYHYRKSSLRRDEGRYNLARDARGPYAPSSSLLLQEPRFLLTPAIATPNEEGEEKLVTPRERKSSLLGMVPRERKTSLNAPPSPGSKKRRSSPLEGLVGFGKALLGGGSSKAG